MEGTSKVDEESPYTFLPGLSVTVGTVRRRTLASEHCTHGIHVPISCTLAALATLRVIVSLGCLRG